MTFQPKSFNCIQCGECCTGFNTKFGVLIFDFEISRLAKALAISGKRFIKRYCVPTRLHAGGNTYQLYRLKYKDGSCVFLAPDKRCSIHPNKPTQCTRTPFGFFWDGMRAFGCMNNVQLPRTWTTTRWDDNLVRRLIPIGRSSKT